MLKLISSRTLSETSNLSNSTSRKNQESRHKKEFKHRSFQHPLEQDLFIYIDLKITSFMNKHQKLDLEVLLSMVK